jgi:hypothetical protein
MTGIRSSLRKARYRYVQLLLIPNSMTRGDSCNGLNELNVGVSSLFLVGLRRVCLILTQ